MYETGPYNQSSDSGVLPVALEQIQMLSPVNHFARRTSRSTLKLGLPHLTNARTITTLNNGAICSPQATNRIARADFEGRIEKDV